jgi:S1-C subfamily serine protease
LARFNPGLVIADVCSVWLTIRSGHDRGRSVDVSDGLVVLGRDDACDVVVDDARVSRRHVELAPRGDGRVALRDLGSSNGTFVNGKRVESALLEGGEQIQVGGTVLASSRTEPGVRAGATELGSLSALTQTPSAVHRRLVERSLRRVTVLATAAIATVAASVLLLWTGVLPLGGDDGAAVERVVARVASSTVLVEVRREGRRVGGGTGWVLDGADGLVVTNAHVVNGGTSILVGNGGGLVDAAIVGVAPCDDLAVLRVHGLADLKSLPLGDQSSLEQGETVVAVGYPANASAEASLTSTTGVVSVVRTAYREPALDVPRYPNVVQTDAAINPGNSGGPLVDLDAQLVGVSSAGRTRAGDGRIVQGQNYAIGVDRVKEIVSVLRNGSSIGWSGLGFEYRSERAATNGDVPGIATLGAVPGTAADRAGLGGGGDVIVAVNGMPLDNSLASYCDAVGAGRSGDKVTFSVLRQGSSQRREVVLTFE